MPACLPALAQHSAPCLPPLPLASTTKQEALKDASAAVQERSGLLARVRDLTARLEEEQAQRGALKDKAARKLAAAEQEVRGQGQCSCSESHGWAIAACSAVLWTAGITSKPPRMPQVAALRGQLEGKARALQGLQADMKALQADAEAKMGACEAQLLACKQRTVALSAEVEAERARAAKVGAAEALQGGRMRHRQHAGGALPMLPQDDPCTLRLVRCRAAPRLLPLHCAAGQGGRGGGV